MSSTLRLRPQPPEAIYTIGEILGLEFLAEAVGRSIDLEAFTHRDNQVECLVYWENAPDEVHKDSLKREVSDFQLLKPR
jgi:hypothetical protein